MFLKRLSFRSQECTEELELKLECVSFLGQTLGKDRNMLKFLIPNLTEYKIYTWKLGCLVIKMNAQTLSKYKQSHL